jgi:hypothetical protein
MVIINGSQIYTMLFKMIVFWWVVNYLYRRRGVAYIEVDFKNM